MCLTESEKHDIFQMLANHDKDILVHKRQWQWSTAIIVLVILPLIAYYVTTVLGSKLDLINSNFTSITVMQGQISVGATRIDSINEDISGIHDSLEQRDRILEKILEAVTD